MQFEEMQQEVYETAKSKGWWDGGGFHVNVPEKIALMHSELSEALEAFRSSKHEWLTVYEVDGKPEGLPIELADCVIRIMDFCGHFGIDLAEAIRIKHEYNKTRPYRHGDKVC